MSRYTPAAPLAELSEREWQRTVVDLAQDLGWKLHEQLPRADDVQPLLSVEVVELPEGLGDTLVGVAVCEIELIGEPTTKTRPRVVRGGASAYTPRKTREAEQSIRWDILQAGVTLDEDHLLRVDVRFRSSTGQRRDLDNLVKLVLDACNGFAWRDDVQVTELHATVERRSTSPGISLAITRIGRYTSDCKRCGVILTDRRGSKQGRNQYCSRACYDEAQRPGVMVACPECAAPVYRQVSEESRLKFCSVECGQQYKRGRRRPYGDIGFPSLSLIRDRVIFIELKSELGKVSPPQQEWLDAINQAGGEAYVIRPRHLEQLATILTAHSRPGDIEGLA